MGVVQWAGTGQDEWRRPPPSAAQRRRDVITGLAVMVGAALSTVLVNSAGMMLFGQAPSLWEQLAWNVAIAAPLVVRTRFPIAVVLVVGAVFIAGQWRQIGDNLLPSIALFMAIHTAGAWGQDRRVARWTRIGVIVAMFGWLGVSFVRALFEPAPAFELAAGPLDPFVAAVLYQIAFNLLYFSMAYYFGNTAWLSARRQAELEHRAEELRLSQQQNIRGAVVAERVRIARDLHDVVAHHVAVMGVQAGAARRVLDRDPAVASDALRAVEETARQAIGDMRGLLRVLRAEEPETTEPTEAHPSPGLDQLDELVASARTAGLTVNHGSYGDPRPVPDGVALSAYRVVQESLTNVVKHAGARGADVRVRYRVDTLEVEVTDDGSGGAGRPTEGGFGLLGMRERVAVHDGELEAGPRPGGGFRVRAVFPLESLAAAGSGS